MSRPRASVSIKTQKELFAHSGNRCTFPGCRNPIVENGIIVGEMCHIKAASPQGPRYDAGQSEVDRQSAGNLILFCANHHKVIDSNPATYTVEALTKMKTAHEKGEHILPPAVVNEVIRSGQTFITNNFYSPINAVALGDATIGSAHQTIETKHRNAAAFKMTVGESGPYFTTIGSNVYSTRRTFKLKVENIDQSRTIHGCKIQLLSTEPHENSQLPWVLDELACLAAGDHKFIPFVRYGEARNPEIFNCSDSFVEVLPPVVACPTLSKDLVHRLHIRVTGVDTPPADLQCRVWVDDDGRLRVEEILGETLVSLSEAARRGYEHTRGTDLSDMAERHDGTPEGVLEYYAMLIIEHQTILVKKPPSTVIEIFPQQLRRKVNLCNQLRGLRLHGSQRALFIDPLVAEKDVSEFLKWTEQYPKTSQDQKEGSEYGS